MMHRGGCDQAWRHFDMQDHCGLDGHPPCCDICHGDDDLVDLYNPVNKDEFWSVCCAVNGAILTFFAKHGGDHDPD